MSKKRDEKTVDYYFFPVEGDEEVRFCFQIPTTVVGKVPRCIPFRKFFPEGRSSRPGNPYGKFKNGTLSGSLSFLLYECGFGLVEYYADDRPDINNIPSHFYSFVFRRVKNQAMDRDVYLVMEHFLRRTWEYVQIWGNPNGSLCIVSKIETRRKPGSYILVCRDKEIEKISEKKFTKDIPSIFIGVRP